MSDLHLKPRFQTEAIPGRVSHRRLPLGPFKVTATTIGAAQAVFEAGEAELAQIGAVVLSNTTGAVVSVTLYIASDVAADSNIAIGSLKVPANGFLQLSDALMITPGQKLMAHAGTSGAIRISGWLTAYL